MNENLSFLFKKVLEMLHQEISIIHFSKHVCFYFPSENYMFSSFSNSKFLKVCMFLGEFIFGLFYVIKKFVPSLKKKQAKGVIIKSDTPAEKPKAKDPNVFYIEDGRSLDEFISDERKKRFANPLIFAVPAFLDFSASVLMYFGLAYTQGKIKFRHKTQLPIPSNLLFFSCFKLLSIKCSEVLL